MFKILILSGCYSDKLSIEDSNSNTFDSIIKKVEDKINDLYGIETLPQ